MKRILLVDDDPDILVLERKILERQGYEIDTADDGTMALELLKTAQFDLLLLDIMMPGMDGFEVSRVVQGDPSLKPVPIVFVTAHDDAESMRQGFRSGGTVFLSKPFTSNQLTRLVKALIDD